MIPYTFPYSTLTGGSNLKKLDMGSAYRRLLPPSTAISPIQPQPAHQERIDDALIALGCLLREREPDPAHYDIPYLASAGFTYFGQFVGHDLTHDRKTALEDTGEAVPSGASANMQNARLGLDNLYGEGPKDRWKQLYETDGLPDKARFKLGPTVSGALRDLQRPADKNGAALVADSPHLENLLLTQLTVVLMRFHNAMLARAQTDPKLLAALPADPKLTSLFEQVRRLVTWHYQWIVIYEYLPQIINYKIWSELNQRYPKEVEKYRKQIRDETPDKPDFLPDSGESFAVPYEFALAAMRYGHSAVKAGYMLNDVLPPPVKMSSLVDRNQFVEYANAEYRLKDEWVVDWDGFFGGVSDDRWVPEASAPLDTQITQGLHELGDKSPFPPQLPVRTLLRGARIGLPSGQEMARALREPHLRPEEIFTADQTQKCPDLDTLGFRTATPLFYYILREAEKENPTDDENSGPWGHRRRLGPVGSRLVGETIFASLYADDTSFMRAAHVGWVPPLARNGTFGMAELIRFVET